MNKPGASVLFSSNDSVPIVSNSTSLEDIRNTLYSQEGIVVNHDFMDIDQNLHQSEASCSCSLQTSFRSKVPVNSLFCGSHLCDEKINEVPGISELGNKKQRLETSCNLYHLSNKGAEKRITKMLDGKQCGICQSPLNAACIQCESQRTLLEDDEIQRSASVKGVEQANTRKRKAGEQGKNNKQTISCALTSSLNCRHSGINIIIINPYYIIYIYMYSAPNLCVFTCPSPCPLCPGMVSLVCQLSRLCRDLGIRNTVSQW